jgi:hypothetical protein
MQVVKMAGEIYNRKAGVTASQPPLWMTVEILAAARHQDISKVQDELHL